MVPAVVLVMGAVTAWGILQSMVLAGLMTLIEISELLTMPWRGSLARPDDARARDLDRHRRSHSAGRYLSRKPS
jgi:hypothetical protein